MSIHCNVCALKIVKPLFSPPGSTSLTSLGDVIGGSADVYFCDNCGHLQTIEIQNVAEYYDKQYKILIDSKDEDQLYKIENGQKIYRYDFQAKTVLSKLNFSQNATVLEYGAAKGASIKRVFDSRPDITPHVFDISEMYIPFWDYFIEKKHQATYTLPAHWHNSVDYVISFYVLEHVANLNQVITDITSLLKDNGKFYFIVPNTYENIADFVVADHVNHFSSQSICTLMQQYGFSNVVIDQTSHESAFIVTGTKSSSMTKYPVSDDTQCLKKQAQKIADFWLTISHKIHHFEDTQGSTNSAIYGAGFYGTFIFSHMKKPTDIVCFVDQNRHLHGKSILGIPIVSPENMPANIDTLYVGLNPKYAHNIIQSAQVIVDKQLTTLYL